MKKKTIQRAFAWALTLVMVLSAAPLGVFAEGEEGQKCTCTVKCGEEGNTECPVCSTDAEKCTFVTPKQEDQGKGEGGTDTLTKNDGGTPSGGEGGPTGNDTTKSGTTNSGSDSTNTNNSSANSSSTGGGKTSDQTGGSGDGTTTGTGSGSSGSKGTPSDKDGEGSGGSGTGENTGNKTEKKTFSISFNVQGHGNKPEDMTTDENGMLTGGLPALNNVEGFTFVGWYLDKECSEGQKYENDRPFNGNTTLYAKWTENTPTGTGSGSSGSKQDESLEFKKNEDIKTSVTYGTITHGHHKITFDVQGHGNKPEDMTTDENGKLSGELPALDNVVGYTFGGWYLEADCPEGKKVNNGDTFTTDTELYAKWTPITYTVTFHDNYSTSNNPYTWTFEYNSSESSKPLGKLKRDYYDFNGWAEAPDGNAIYEQTHNVGDLVFGQETTLDLYAVWRYVPRQVTFNACGGTITKDGQEVTSDEVKTQESPLNTVKAEDVPTPTRAGYAFLGWYDQNTNNKFSLNTPYNENTILKARWVVLDKPDYVTLGENFLNENSEKLKPGTEKVEIRVEEGSKTRLNQISILLDDKLDGKKLLAVYDLSVYMIIGSEHQPLTPVNGLIRFDFPVTGNVAAVYHDTTPMPQYDDSGTNPGYRQTGSTLTIWANSFSPYAIAIDGYRITLDAQGGTLAAGVSNSMLTDPDGILKNLPKPPTKTGYTFGGWYRNEKCEGEEVKAGAKFESNATIYAKWTPITYTVVFHDNYRKPEKEETSEQTLTYDQEERLSYDDTKIKREYYQLDGWAETRDGEQKYGTNQQVKNLCSQQGAEKHLYAVWSYLPRTVIFDADGGKIKDKGQEVYSVIVKTQESPINTVNAKEVPVPMTREGYYFGGWYTQKEGKGDLVKPDKTEFPEGRTTVYAYWIKFEPVTVTFKCQGGTARIGSTDVKEFTMQTKWPGVLDGTPTTPSRSSYKFEGWYTAAGVKVDEDTLFLQDTTVYARWKRAVSITGNPRTGDQVKLEAAIAILVAAAIGLGATVVLKKRKDK